MNLEPVAEPEPMEPLTGDPGVLGTPTRAMPTDVVREFKTGIVQRAAELKRAEVQNIVRKKVREEMLDKRRMPSMQAQVVEPPASMEIDEKEPTPAIVLDAEADVVESQAMEVEEPTPAIVLDESPDIDFEDVVRPIKIGHDQDAIRTRRTGARNVIRKKTREEMLDKRRKPQSPVHVDFSERIRPYKVGHEQDKIRTRRTDTRAVDRKKTREEMLDKRRKGSVTSLLAPAAIPKPVPVQIAAPKTKEYGSRSRAKERRTEARAPANVAQTRAEVPAVTVASPMSKVKKRRRKSRQESISRVKALLKGDRKPPFKVVDPTKVPLPQSPKRDPNMPSLEPDSPDIEDRPFFNYGKRRRRRPVKKEIKTEDKKPTPMDIDIKFKPKPIRKRPPPKPRKRRRVADDDSGVKAIRMPKLEPGTPPAKPKPKPKPKAKESKPEPVQKQRAASPRGRRGDGSRTSADMRVAPTQQVTVAGGRESAGLQSLIKKIEELLLDRKKEKLKTNQKKKLSNAKKVYRDYRKSKLAEVKRNHKEFKRKQLLRIRRLPTADRPAARKKLNDEIKAREADLKRRLPSKISPEALQKLFAGNKTKAI